MAIRAAPTGVTSIHIGVRPRIHPSRTDESLSRNQPDLNLPEPLFSPSNTTNPLTPEDPNDTDGTTVRGSYNQMYKSELAEKAKKEYEDWLARKDEREGRRDDGEGYQGAQEWVPRERTQARFGELNQPVPNVVEYGAGNMGMGGNGMKGQGGMVENGHGNDVHQYPHHQIQAGGAGRAGGIGGDEGEEGGNQQVYIQYDQNGYPYQQQQQPYFDPMAYWWMMAQMGMLSMEDMQSMGMMPQGWGMQGGDGVSPITSEEESQTGSSDDGTVAS